MHGESPHRHPTGFTDRKIASEYAETSLWTVVASTKKNDGGIAGGCLIPTAIGLRRGLLALAAHGEFIGPRMNQMKNNLPAFLLSD